MPAFNAARYIEEAIGSILNQTYNDFELLIINDASTDNTIDIVNLFSDSRIKLISNKRNLKLAGTLNRGINQIDSKYIVRMDADDISHPQRLEKLIDFMDLHPETDICSTWLATFGHGDIQTMSFPLGDGNIKSQLLFGSSIAHAASIWRTSSLKKHKHRFNENIQLAQDYDYWERGATFLQYDNIPEVLYYYRYINTDKHFAGQQDTANQVRERQILKLGISSSSQEKEFHHAIARWDFEKTYENFKKLDLWFSKLLNANNKTGQYPEKEFYKMLCDKWYMSRDTIFENKNERNKAILNSTFFGIRYKVAYFRKI